jgi:hypothetical protein
MREPHFYDVTTSTIEQSHIKGYSTSGWYLFKDESESEVVGPFQGLEEAEAARKETNQGSVDTDDPET